MATTTRVPRFAVRLSLLGLLFASGLSHSEETKDWDISPNLGLELAYTSNLDLTPDNEIDSFISRINPGIGISQAGRNLKLGVDYSLSLVNYSSEKHSNDYYHNLNAFADAELVDDRLFLDTRATVSQELIDNRNSGIGDPSVAPDSYTSTLTFVITPTWKQRIGDYTNIGISATYDAVIYERGDNEDSESLEYNFFADTHDNPNKVYWTLEARQDNARPRGGDTSLVKEDFIEAQLGYRYSRQLNLRAGGGYIDNHVKFSTDPSLEAGSFWSAGLTWNPTPRANLDMYYSSQVQTGSGQGLTFTNRHKYSFWSLSYNKSLSSTRDELLQFAPVGSAICPDTVDFSLNDDCTIVGAGEQAIAGPGEQVVGLFTPISTPNEGRFIREALNANVSYRRSKSTVTFGLFGIQRTYQNLNGRVEEDYGVNAGWALRLSGRTSANIDLNWSILEPNTNETITERDHKQGVNLGLTRRLSTDTSVKTALRFNKLHSDDPSRDYDEYGASVSLNHTF
ncbi:MAG: TIGR03016 family PEP-CTERM system-associated outer membrane protein [Halopseudomonas sp.]